MLVTGWRKGRRVRGHFGAMRSWAMATSSSSSSLSSLLALVLMLSPAPERVAECCCCCCCCCVCRFWVSVSVLWIPAAMAWVFGVACGRFGGSNQVEAGGRGGMLSLGNLASWVMR